MQDIRDSREYKKLERALNKSLRDRGLTAPMYRDKAQEYMDFWARRQELKADIAARGLTVVDERGRQSENRSVSLEIQVSRQMLTLWNALGFKAEDLSGENIDEL